MKEGGLAVRLARAIYGGRLVFVVVWPALAVVFAPFGYLLLSRISGGLKQAPPGTKSFAALHVFEDHFSDLAKLRTEKVVSSCKVPCATAANTLSRGLAQQIVGIIQRFNQTVPGSILRIQSYYTFAAHHADDIMGGNQMLSRDRQSILLQWAWTPSLLPDKSAAKFIAELQRHIEAVNDMSGPNGMVIKLTGLYTLDVQMKTNLIKDIVIHEATTLWLPFLILALALQSPRMLLLALIPMGIELPVGLGIMYWASMDITVLLYAVEMMLMLMTSLSFDYALFLLTRYAEERRNGAEVEDAIITMLSQPGRVVVTSGLVLVISWASMMGLPAIFVGFSMAAAIMILVCVSVQLTFTPSLLAILPVLGPPATRKSDISPMVSVSRSSRGTEDKAFAKAEPHMRGVGHWLGGYLTAFPLNILLALLVYLAMAPLSRRFLKSFDVFTFRFHMGHLFETQVPRGTDEWATALQIQRDFPNSMGVLMPMMIIAASVPDSPPRTGASVLALPPPTSNGSTAANPADQIDVRKQAFFDANCHMLNALLDSTKGTEYELTDQNFVSLTVHGASDDGSLECVDYWKVKLVQENWWSQHVFLKHTAELTKVGWDSMVSDDNSAMISFVFPAMDPFGDAAFDLARKVRQVLANESAVKIVDVPGLTFMVFSPGTAIMDLIEITEGQLPVAFITCVVISFLLVACMFRAVFVPLKLILTVLVPITWTYGAALYVYEEGILDFFGVPCIMATGTAGVDWSVPVFSLTFLVGLALDYDVFLFERVREFREEGFGDREAIQLGLAATGGTISAAGIIMALSFGGSTLLGSLPGMNQLGFVLVFSIVVDTFLVRTILVPAMLSLSPALNYWPSRMPTPRYCWLGQQRHSGDVAEAEASDSE